MLRLNDMTMDDGQIVEFPYPDTGIFFLAANFIRAF